MIGSLQERYLAKVDIRDPAECWPWLGARTPAGYGLMQRGGRGGGLAYAHRLTWEMFVEPIPDGLVIDHLCRHPGCQNPDHMEIVTMPENSRRGALRRWAIYRGEYQGGEYDDL